MSKYMAVVALIKSLSSDWAVTVCYENAAPSLHSCGSPLPYGDVLHQQRHQIRCWILTYKPSIPF